MLQLDIQIAFSALTKVVHVTLVRRRHRENVSANGLGVNGASTKRQGLGKPHIRGVMGRGGRESCVFEALVGGGGHCQRSIDATNGEHADNLRRVHVSECWWLKSDSRIFVRRNTESERECVCVSE